MKTFKELSEEYKELIEGAKLKKKKVFKPDEKGNLKKVLKKYCADSDGSVAKGFKIVDGKQCKKMTPDEVKTKTKAMKKVMKTKKKNSTKIAKRAEMIRKKRESKGLIAKKVDTETK
jgi:hypothetical protein